MKEGASEIWTPDSLLLEAQQLVGDDLTGTTTDYSELAHRLDAARPEGNVAVTLENVLPPIDVNAREYAVGLNSPNHKEACGFGRDKPGKPTMFPKTMRVTTHGDPVYLIGEGDHKLDPEVELMVIIGRDAKNVSIEDAMDYVAGYAVHIDWADRGVQGVDVNDGKTGLERFEVLCQWSDGKSGDGYGPVGPVLAFVDDPMQLGLELDVRGRPQQRLDAIGNDIFFSIPEIIAYRSRISTLPAGSGIVMGSTNGVEVEHVLDPNDPVRIANYLDENDIAEGAIPELGRVINKVVVHDYKPAR